MTKLSTQFVVLVCVSLLGMIGLVLGLAVLADWSDGAIVGMVSGFGTLATGLIFAVRNQEKAANNLDNLQRVLGASQRDQAGKMDTVVKQTNDLSDLARQDIADKAVRTVMNERDGA